MAGRGSRLAGLAGLPKPLIPVAGRPMVAWALQSLVGFGEISPIFVALAEHEHEFGLRAALAEVVGRDPVLVLLDDVTEGQLCTVLAARDLLLPEEDLLIASADTLVASDLAVDIAGCRTDTGGIISVIDLPGDRWSFARTDDSGAVVEVAEKVRISNLASTGLYYFASAGEFMDAADEMIARGEKTRAEYYVIPVYGKYIERGHRVEVSVAREMWDMGTPDAIATFERHLDRREVS